MNEKPSIREESGGGTDSSEEITAFERRQLDTNTDIRERLSAIETDLSHYPTHYATREDLQRVKIWVLGGVLGGVVAVLIATISALIRIYIHPTG